MKFSTKTRHPGQLALYDLALGAYRVAIWMASFFNPKAKAWWEGRLQTLATMQGEGFPKEEKPLIWMHCASLGEFEQGRPVLELLKRLQPSCKIVLTFFSPSGYQVRQNYPVADQVLYLPFDHPKQVRKFVAWLQPDLVFFVKYEFWFHLLLALKERNIPTFLISAVFRENQVFFRPFGGIFRELLSSFDRIFVQNEQSRRLLAQIGIPDTILAGDTRVDRVIEIAAHPEAYPLLELFSASHKVLVVGSSWGPDEDLLAPLINRHLPEGWKCVLAPHQIDDTHIEQIQRKLSVPSIRYTRMQPSDAEARVLILDTIGMLAHSYQYGDLAYIGGGFGQGIHNILEPAAHGLPVLFGPKYQKFPEAVALVQEGGAFCVDTPDSLQRHWQEMLDDNLRHLAIHKVRAYVEAQRGATRIIVKTALDLLEKKHS